MEECEEDELLAMLDDEPNGPPPLSQGEKEALLKQSQGAVGSQKDLDDDELAWLMGDTVGDDRTQPMDTAAARAEHGAMFHR